MKNKHFTNFKSFLINEEGDNSSGNRKMISFEEAADLINSQCKEWENALGGFSQSTLDWIFYRGVELPFHPDSPKAYLAKTRKNRRPLDTNFRVHEIADDYFLKKYGVRFRSQGIFTLRNEDLASFYGNTFMFFPLGKVNYIWSETQMDLGASLLGKEFHFPSSQKLKSVIHEIIDNAKYHFNEDLNLIRDPQFTRNEVVVDCENYVLVDALAKTAFINFLFERRKK